jgi:hypothetical protein
MTKTIRSNPVIWITFGVPGIHRYPNAPDEVAYLRNEHRHIFQYKVTLEVTHDNREVEFHMLKNELTGLFKSGVVKADYKSCEMLASDVMDYLDKKYPGRYAQVDVSEDGECGATLTREHVLDTPAGAVSQHCEEFHDSL